MSHAQTLANGKHVHFRRTQMLLWTAIAAVLGAAFIAGLYFGILEANWHVFDLKPGWDGLFKQAWWPTYRHSAFRDIPEPAFAVMGILTLLAKQKYWDKQVSTLRLVVSPFILILATIALGIGGTWLLHYGLPLHVRNVLANHSAGNLILGFAIGRIMHVFWAPVGATIQGHLLQASVSRAATRQQLPVWVRLPIAPPTLRERFSKMYREHQAQTYTLEATSVGAHLVYSADKTPASSRAWLITSMAVVFTLVTLLGLAGHYYAGTGHVIPWLMN